MTTGDASVSLKKNSYCVTEITEGDASYHRVMLKTTLANHCVDFVTEADWLDWFTEGDGHWQTKLVTEDTTISGCGSEEGA